MKAPHTPAQFRTSIRHYHRARPAHSGDWESWVGDPAKRRKRLIRKLSISLAIIALLGISLGAMFLFGGF